MNLYTEVFKKVSQNYDTPITIFNDKAKIKIVDILSYFSSNIFVNGTWITERNNMEVLRQFEEYLHKLFKLLIENDIEGIIYKDINAFVMAGNYTVTLQLGLNFKSEYNYFPTLDKITHLQDKLPANRFQFLPEIVETNLFDTLMTVLNRYEGKTITQALISDIVDEILENVAGEDLMKATLEYSEQIVEAKYTVSHSFDFVHLINFISNEMHYTHVMAKYISDCLYISYGDESCRMFKERVVGALADLMSKLYIVNKDNLDIADSFSYDTEYVEEMKSFNLVTRVYLKNENKEIFLSHYTLTIKREN